MASPISTAGRGVSFNMYVWGFPKDSDIHNLTEFDAMVCSFYGVDEMIKVQGLSRESEEVEILNKEFFRTLILARFRKKIMKIEVSSENKVG